MDTIQTAEDLFKFLKSSGTRIVANIMFAGSPGHQVLELDYFLRKYAGGDIPKDGKYLWVQRNGDITATMAEVYGDHFRHYHLGMVAHDQLFELAVQVTRMVPELDVDVGLSHLKNSVLSRDHVHVGRFSNETYYMVTNEAVMRETVHYFKLRAITEDFRPFRSAKPDLNGPLIDLLGGSANAERYALVHIRQRPGNAGTVMPPENLFPSFEYLKDNGYTLIKAGTEPYPEQFSRYDVVNYTNSPLRNFKNDLTLLSNSKLNIINGSGFANLSDVMDTPVVDFGRWHLPIGPYSSKTVIVPALLYDPQRQELLNFAEQILFFKTRQEIWEGQFFGWHFPIDRFVARVPQADELLAAVQESLAGTDAEVPLTPLQVRFNRLDENGLLSILKSRISNFYLQRFENLL